MIVTYSELTERQKEQVGAQFSLGRGDLENYAYEINSHGTVLSRSAFTKINIFGQMEDGSLRLLLQDIPVKAGEASTEGTRTATSLRSDPSVVDAWWDFAGNGYAPKERGVDKFTERENATFGKRTPKGKREGCFDV